VASAKGGVGKSTVATTLACALAADDGVGLFDADLHGPNVPALLDVSGPVRADEEGNPRPVETGDDGAAIEVMSAGLLGSDHPLGWRGAMAHEAVSDLFADTAWAVDETLVVDLPPGMGDVVLTTLQEVPIDGVVVVTTPFETSVADTRRSVELFRDEGVPVLGAVVNMATFTCPSCGDTHPLFDDSGDEFGAPVLAELAFDRELQTTAEPGSVPEDIVEMAATVRAAADDAWTVDPPEGTIDIRGTPAAERRERVRRAFTLLAPGEPFHLLSDRDPSPVVAFLAELADEPTAAFDVTVERRTPDDWLLSTTKP
jgi:ATP-binding protein involved in chromosome partitioning